MKHANFWAGFVAAVVVLMAVLGSLMGAVSHVTGDPALYGAKSRAAVASMLGNADDGAVTAYIGLDENEQAQAAAQLAAYMANSVHSEMPDIVLERDGVRTAVLNEEEARHLHDVRTVVVVADSLSKSTVSFAAALAVLSAWLRAKEKRSRPALRGALAGMGILLAAVLGVAVLLKTYGFGKVFEGVHRILFAGELWAMDSAHDLLIRMMPQNLFEGAALAVLARAALTGGILLAMLGAVYFIVSNLIANHLTQGDA